MALAQRGWLVGISHRTANGAISDYQWFYVGCPTKEAAVNALRQNLGTGANARQATAARELSSLELALSKLRIRQVRYHVTAAQAPSRPGQKRDLNPAAEERGKETAVRSVDCREHEMNRRETLGTSRTDQEDREPARSRNAKQAARKCYMREK